MSATDDPAILCVFDRCAIRGCPFWPEGDRPVGWGMLGVEFPPVGDAPGFLGAFCSEHAHRWTFSREHHKGQWTSEPWPPLLQAFRERIEAEIARGGP